MPTDTAHKSLVDSKRYIAVIPNAWGKGHTQQEALRNAKREGGNHPSYVYLAEYDAKYDKEVYMDNTGFLFYPKTPGSYRVIKDTRKA